MSRRTPLGRPLHRVSLDTGPVGEVLFVLLFLVGLYGSVAVNARSTIEVQLARLCFERYELSRPVTVEVLPGPTYRLDGEPLGEDLESRLRRTYAARADRVIHVVGHPGVTYQQVITAMDVARGAGARVVVVRVRPLETREPCPPDPPPTWRCVFYH
jgi:biopolymer transport protein ExbD